MSKRPPTQSEGRCRACKRDFGPNTCKSCKRPFDVVADTTRVTELRSQVTAKDKIIRQLEAAHPVNGLTSENREMLRRLTALLVDLEEAADPLRSSPIETQSRYRRPDSSVDEGVATRWARVLMRRIHSSVEGFAHEYERRVDGAWEPPMNERVRCRNTTCEAEGKRIPKFIGPKNSIELIRCPKCDGKLTPA